MPDDTDGFHDVRFPLELAFGARGGPVRATNILTLSNGAEVRNAKGRHSRRRYNAIAGLKSESQAIELLSFFEARFGPLYGFRFRDPLDHMASSEIGIGDAAQTEFNLIKSYGEVPHTYFRRITKPVNGSVRAFIDGVQAAFFVDYDRGIIRFETAPPADSIVTADFEFDVPVRFASDSLDMVLDDFGAVQIQGIPLIEILPSEDVSYG